MGRVIGRRRFTDGLERDVYEDDDGRQYVLDGDGEKVCGVWLWPADEPGGQLCNAGDSELDRGLTRPVP
jgi:hypothetical protein